MATDMIFFVDMSDFLAKLLLKSLSEHLLWIFNVKTLLGAEVFELYTCEASQHAELLHNAINYFQRLN